MKKFNLNYFKLSLLTLSFIFLLQNPRLSAQCAGSEIIGNAVKFTVYNSIGNAANSLGSPDGTLTNVLNTDDAIVLDLGEIIHYSSGSIDIIMTRTNNTGRATIDGSLDGLNFYDAITDVGSSFTNNNLETVSFSISRPTRFIRISRTAGKLKIDGVTYSTCLDTDLDGIIDVTEISSGSDPEDACSPSYLSLNYLDCDKDGVSNADEDATNGLDPCTPNGFSPQCDEDGDGVNDAYDDCPGTPLETVVNSYGCPTSITCAYEPENTSPIFTPALVWSTTPYIDARETPLVGDVTGDGKTDVVLDNYQDNILIIDGQDGSIQYTIDVPGDNMLDQNNSSNAIADVDSDGYGEIFTLRKDSIWVRFDFDGTNWTSTIAGGGIAAAFDNQYTPGLIDFDGDGNVELYAGSQIWRTDFDGTTNDLLVDAGDGVIDLGGSVAIDILPTSACADCAGLELVMAGRVYSVNLATSTITEEVRISNLTDAWTNGRATSIADMDLDGDYDVVYSVASSNKSYVYVWDGQTDAIILAYELINTAASVGRVNIADFDNDGFLEMGVHYKVSAGNGEYIVLDDIVTTVTPKALWKISTNDGSGITGSTVYDFDGDGAAEVVYRDETSLRILDGKTGTVKFLTPCSSATRWEYPVIADVNDDGTTNIICTCNGERLSLFKSASDPWIPARSVWNQHGYNITNINDDLTIPLVPDNNLTKGGGQFNNFLVQAVALDDSGDPATTATADATITDAVINAVNTCPTSGSMDVTIKNIGDKALSSSTEITIYNGDPENSAAAVLATEPLGVNLNPNASHTITILTNGCADSDAYIVVNDPGTVTRPYDYADFPISGVSECDYTNNSYKLVEFLPIELTYFRANPEGENVRLEWETQTEINNDYFTIERSKHGDIWEDVTEVSGAGDATDPIQYKDYDYTPYTGTSYYRLKQTDFDGSYSYSNIEKVYFDGETEIENILAYPNPTKDNLNLEITSANDTEVTLEVVDMQGKLLYQKTINLSEGNNIHNIGMGQFSNGMYLISIKADKYLKTLNIVKTN